MMAFKPLTTHCDQNAHGSCSVGFLVCAGLLATVVAGCGKPNIASIEVRRSNQTLRDEVAGLKRAREADAATIKALEARATTVPSLPTARLEDLFTTHGLQLGRLTGGADLDRNKPGDEGLKVYATPTDDEGQPFKAAGSFVVEAFDLSANPPQVGRWTFDTKTARGTWVGMALARAFVLTCPWQTPPQHAELTVKVTFRDELTGREFHEQKLVKIQPPAPAPSTAESR
jgi:hypothetical protein